MTKAKNEANEIAKYITQYLNTYANDYHLGSQPIEANLIAIAERASSIDDEFQFTWYGSTDHQSKAEIEQDVKLLLSKWQKIKNEADNSQDAPRLIFKTMGITEKLIIDLENKNIERIILDNQEEYDHISEMLKEYGIEKNIKLELNQKDDILDLYEIQKQKDKLSARKIWLNCGGFITIDPTEALTAIDVNTGKYMGTNSLEDTVYKVNQEATIEIARQLRLRDIGGIIIIDYIDMLKPENKEKIEKLLKQQLKNDRAKTQVEGFTKLDLMELTRKHICSHRD